MRQDSEYKGEILSCIKQPKPHPMDEKDILSRLQVLEQLVAKHDHWIAELLSKQAHAEMLQQVEAETSAARKNVLLEELIVAKLKEHGEIETINSEKVKLSADEIRAEFQKRAGAALKRLKGMEF